MWGHFREEERGNEGGGGQGFKSKKKEIQEK